MKRLIPLFSVLILLLLCSPASAQQTPSVPAEVDALVEQAITLITGNLP